MHIDTNESGSAVTTLDEFTRRFDEVRKVAERCPVLSF